MRNPYAHDQICGTRRGLLLLEDLYSSCTSLNEDMLLNVSALLLPATGRKMLKWIVSSDRISVMFSSTKVLVIE